MAALVDDLAASGVALEGLWLYSTNPGPKAAAALGKWLRVDGAAANLNMRAQRAPGRGGTGGDQRGVPRGRRAEVLAQNELARNSTMQEIHTRP